MEAGETSVKDGSGTMNIASEDEGICETITSPQWCTSSLSCSPSEPAALLTAPLWLPARQGNGVILRGKFSMKSSSITLASPLSLITSSRPLCTPQILSGFPKFICALLFIYVQLTCETPAERSRRSQIAMHVLNNNTHPKDLAV